MSVAAPDGSATLELSLDPQDAERLAKLPELVRLRQGRARTTPVQMVWHDTPGGALAADGLALCERQVGGARLWRLERLRGTPAAPWPPGTPAPVVAEAERPTALGLTLPSPLLAVAACAGQMRAFPLVESAGTLTVTLLQASLRAVAGELAVCRVVLSGPPGEVADLALALAGPVRLAVPAGALAAEAHAVAGRRLPPRAAGAPRLPDDVGVGAAFASVAGHLACVLVGCAPTPAAGETAEPVHQMRVALRRLRSALSLFRRAVGCAELDAVTADLRELGRVLGPVRDWDVFVGGIGRAIAEAFPGDRAVAHLLAAAERRRLDAYATLRAFLDGPGFRRLGIRLACVAALRPWQDLPPSDPADEAAARRAADLALPLAEFAAHALSRRLAHVLEAGDDLAGLSPEQLHAVRIQAKRLRYAAEVFAPLFPPRETNRCIRRVTALQELLGHANDGVVAAALMAELGGGGERRHAVGIVRGFIAADTRNERASLMRKWKKFRRLEPFWS